MAQDHKWHIKDPDHMQKLSVPARDKISVNDDADDDDATIQGSEFNENQYCVCFRTYEEDQLEETGLLWVQCVCRRWIHEDCYEDVLTDKNGRELICPYCVILMHRRQLTTA